MFHYIHKDYISVHYYKGHIFLLFSQCDGHQILRHFLMHMRQLGRFHCWKWKLYDAILRINSKSKLSKRSLLTKHKHPEYPLKLWDHLSRIHSYLLRDWLTTFGINQIYLGLFLLACPFLVGYLTRLCRWSLFDPNNIIRMLNAKICSSSLLSSRQPCVTLIPLWLRNVSAIRPRWFKHNALLVLPAIADFGWIHCFS